MLILRLLLCLGLVATAACGRGDSSPAVPEQRVEQIPVKVSYEIKGDIQASVVDQAVTSQFILVRSDDPQAKDSQVLGVEPVEQVPAGRVSFKAGFAVMPFRGDGTYTIDAGAPEDAAKDPAKKSGSSVRVEWSPTGKLEDSVEFTRREKPCTVKVSDGGTTGRLTCPSLTHTGSDQRFSLEMRWDVV